jgi:hypothetical protein
MQIEMFSLFGCVNLVFSIERKSVLENSIFVIEEWNSTEWIILRRVVCVVSRCNIWLSIVEPETSVFWFECLSKLSQDFVCVWIEIIKTESLLITNAHFYKVAIISNKYTRPFLLECISIRLINYWGVWEDPLNLWEDLMP